MNPTVLLLTVCLILQAPNCSQCSASSEESSNVKEDDSAGEADDFQPEQLAQAKESLSRMFADKLDSDRDGKLTRRELIDWLAAANKQRLQRELDEVWEGYNLTGSGADEALLDWETHANRRAAGFEAGEAAASDSEAEEQRQKKQAEFHAEVKRAIEEASRETGLDKTGIKVGVPELPTAQPKSAKKAAGGQHPEGEPGGSTEEQHQNSLALELGRDRRRWDAADADGDGRLSRREFAAFALAEGASEGQTPAMKRVLALEALERLDSDGDGRVSLNEFLGGAPPPADKDDAKNFRDVWDVNKDGQMDADEMEKMLEYLGSAGSQEEGKDGAADEAEAAEEADRLIGLADSDKDGSLSREEVLAALREFSASAVTDYGGAVGIHDEL